LTEKNQNFPLCDDGSTHARTNQQSVLQKESGSNQIVGGKMEGLPGFHIEGGLAYKL
jgi:hypothetical protein